VSKSIISVGEDGPACLVRRSSSDKSTGMQAELLNCPPGIRTWISCQPGASPGGSLQTAIHPLLPVLTTRAGRAAYGPISMRTVSEQSSESSDLNHSET
jgi:hypothetical protein